MNNDCKDCTKRHVGCHATCESYAAFRIKLDMRNEQIKRAKEKHDIVPTAKWKGKRRNV